MSLSFEIERGLFKLDFTDYHAILGISVDADARAIRKRYLGIARRLHPDVCRSENREFAQGLLSKLVNPAYAKFSNERELTDYMVLMRMIGKRVQQEAKEVELTSDRAKALLDAPNYEAAYQSALSEVVANQYDDLSRTLDTIGEASELNFAYLYRREQSNKGWPQPKDPQQKRPPVPPPPQRPSNDAFVEQYLQRAQSFMEQKSFAQARKELQDALKLEPDSSRCHGMMALVYIQQNEVKPAKVNLTMANSHATKALKLNPKEPIAQEARKTLNRIVARSGETSRQPKAKTAKKPDKKSDKGRGGLFGLFGKNK